MKRKGFLLLLSVLLVALCLVACDSSSNVTTPTTTTDSTPTCNHTYDDTWSMDEQYHWYAANCEHTDMKANYAAHIDAENDGICDTCGYGSDHTHTYATEWTTDATNHWYAPTCGHSVKGSEAAHVDGNNDGACDVCAYNGGHEHTFAAEWSSDADNHWYAITCGHAVDGKDKAAHTDSDNDGTCDVCAYNGGHEHTFASEWSSDADNHWYAVTCGHTVEVKDKAAHTDANNDGACDVCAYNGGHEHTYEETWSKDDEGHWYAVSCGHDVAVKDYADHTDEDGDEVCDICGFSSHVHAYNTTEWAYNATMHWHAATCGCSNVIDLSAHDDPDNDGVCNTCPYTDGCTHPYSSEWSFDADNHWHAVECTHSIANADTAAHVDANKDGICEICNGYDKDHVHTYEEGVWTVGANEHWVKVTCGHTGHIKEAFKHNDMDGDNLCDVCNGVVSFQTAIDLGTSTESADKVNGGTIIDSSANTKTDYLFGDGYFYSSEDYDGAITDSYYMVDVNGNVLGIQKFTGGWNDGVIQRDNGADISYFDGPYINCGSYTYYNVYGLRGVENMLYSVYEWAKTSINGGVGTESYDEETGVWSFSLDYFEAGYYSNVLYRITVSFTMTEDYVIDSLTIHTVSYDGENTIIYNESTGTYEVAEGAEPSQDISLTITQTIGERTATSPYDPEDVFIGSYDFVDEEGNLMPDTIYVTAGEMQYFYVANILPETAILSLENIECVAPSGVTAYYSTWSNYLMIGGSVAGTYEATITTTNVTKTVTIVVSNPPATYVDAQIYTESWGSYEGEVTDQVTAYIGMPILFGTSVNQYADGRFTYKVLGTNASDLTLTEVVLSSWNGDFSAIELTASVVGTYEIELTLVSNSALSTTLTVTVIEPPTMSDILNGTYSDSWGTNTAVFTPDAEGATTGTVKMTGYKYWQTVTEVCRYAYDAATGSLTLEHVEGDEIGYEIVINSDFTISFVEYGLEQAILEKQEEASIDYSVIDGTWTSDEGYVLSFNASTMSGVFATDSSYNSMVGFTFELSEDMFGDYTITFTEDPYSHWNEADALALFNFDYVNGGSFVAQDGSILMAILAHPILGSNGFYFSK